MGHRLGRHTGQRVARSLRVAVASLVFGALLTGCQHFAGERQVRRMRQAYDDLVWQEARLAVRHQHEETLLRLRVLATALGSYQVDTNGYPPTLAGAQPYAPHVQAVDGWNNDLQYAVIDNGRDYALTAPGQDGKLGTVDDYEMRSGQITRMADVRKLRVDPLPLPGAEHPPRM